MCNIYSLYIGSKGSVSCALTCDDFGVSFLTSEVKL